MFRQTMIVKPLETNTKTDAPVRGVCPLATQDKYIALFFWLAFHINSYSLFCFRRYCYTSI